MNSTRLTNSTDELYLWCDPGRGRIIELCMPSFADSIFLFVMALLLFGPKKLPVLARELGKWIGEFRRASNEFKVQMEDELRAVEQADRQKQIAAMEAAAPVPPPLGEPAEPEHPHLRPPASPNHPPPPLAALPLAEAPFATQGVPSQEIPDQESAGEAIISAPSANTFPSYTDKAQGEVLDDVRPLPIASSGDLHIMPPATGLPTPRQRSPDSPTSGPPPGDPLGGLLSSIPESAPAPAETFAIPAQEVTTHGD